MLSCSRSLHSLSRYCPSKKSGQTSSRWISKSLVFFTSTEDLSTDYVSEVVITPIKLWLDFLKVTVSLCQFLWVGRGFPAAWTVSCAQFRLN